MLDQIINPLAQALLWSALIAFQIFFVLRKLIKEKDSFQIQGDFIISHLSVVLFVIDGSLITAVIWLFICAFSLYDLRKLSKVKVISLRTITDKEEIEELEKDLPKDEEYKYVFIEATIKESKYFGFKNELKIMPTVLKIDDPSHTELAMREILSRKFDIIL